MIRAFAELFIHLCFLELTIIGSGILCGDDWAQLSFCMAVRGVRVHAHYTRSAS